MQNTSKIQVKRAAPVAHVRTYTNRFRAANDDAMSLWQVVKLASKQIKSFCLKSYIK